MEALRHPATRFVLAGVLLLGAVVWVTNQLISRAAEREALADARALTRVLAKSVAEPAVTDRLAGGDIGAVDRFTRAVGDDLRIADVRRVKIWNADGLVVWADTTQLIGEVFALGADERAVLESGGSEAELSDLSRPENQFEATAADAAGLVEVYTRIESPDGTPLLFEAYFSVADIEAREQEVLAPFLRIAVLATLLFIALAAPVIWVLARRLSRAAAERERLLQRSMDASAAERRRIARDLHDGVVQDLAGSTFTVAAVARDSQLPADARASLGEASESLRHSLRGLRSLLVEIHPPDLGAAGLRAALVDLTAPAAAQGLATSVDVVGADHVGHPTAALLWRAAQEAVRNTLRHASASRLEVRVEGSADGARLTVADDGVGFDPAVAPSGDSFGLRGLESLVQDAGGSIVVRSAPGAGTTIVVEVPR